jgi:hypothetical protein
MDLPSDFKELLEELARDGVEFLLVGGYAVAFHGRPRATKDIAGGGPLSLDARPTAGRRPGEPPSRCAKLWRDSVRLRW